MGKERETLRCKVRKGAGTWRERGSRSTGVWEEVESPRGRAGRSTGLQGGNRNTKAGKEARTLGWYGAVGEVKQDHKTVGGGRGWGALNRGEARVGFPCQSSRQVSCGWYLGESAPVTLAWVGRSREDTCQSDQMTEKVAGRCGMNRVDRGAESEAWKLNCKARALFSVRSYLLGKQQIQPRPESRDAPVALGYVLGVCSEVDATCKLSHALITTGLYRGGEPQGGVHRWSHCLEIRIPSLDISFHWPHPNCSICIFIPHQVIVSPFRCCGASTYPMCVRM